MKEIELSKLSDVIVTTTVQLVSHDCIYNKS